MHVSDSPSITDVTSEKHINVPKDVATDYIEGLVETYPGLQYLEGFPDVKVVLRVDVPMGTYDKVAIISGGGTGHEPAHTGYVGEGMLTAAICGDIFAAPPVDSILAGIRAVTGPPGCLLIVKNYTASRLNFCLAAEQAKSEGYKVEMVIVGDDCALPPQRGAAGRRGLAGTVLVHKVAGAAAAAGLSLAEVTAEAKRASEMVGTVGVALSVALYRGHVRPDRLASQKIELGLGIHREPHASEVDSETIETLVTQVLNEILSKEKKYVPITPGSRVVLMVNGLGATTLMELMIVAGKAVVIMQLHYGLAVERVFTGTFMTSFDTSGVSITLMEVDESILERLDAPTRAPSWPVGVDGFRPCAKIPLRLPPSPAAKNDEALVQLIELNDLGVILEAAIKEAIHAVMGLKKDLNEWDSKFGDGDCGSNMDRGATAIFGLYKKCYPLNDPVETVRLIECSLRKFMPGKIGAIYNVLFKAAHTHMKAASGSVITAQHWAGALEAGINLLSKYGGATAGDRTVLDALIPASSVLNEKLAAGVDPVEAFVLSAEAAVAGAEDTRNMHPQEGRSPASLPTVPDPGAMGTASWYKAAALAVKSRYDGTYVSNPYQEFLDDAFARMPFTL